MAFSHGSNDAQKTMGVITLALFSAGFPLSVDAKGVPNIPWEVIMLAAVAMALGTAAGGWRIIHTMGNRLVRLEPIHGFAAETTGATIIEAASRFGFPLSTTHVISSCILGVGAARRLSGVRWSVAFNMIRAWVFTIPVCAAISFCAVFGARLGILIPSRVKKRGEEFFLFRLRFSALQGQKIVTEKEMKGWLVERGRGRGAADMV